MKVSLLEVGAGSLHTLGTAPTLSENTATSLQGTPAGNGHIGALLGLLQPRMGSSSRAALRGRDSIASCATDRSA